MGAPIQLVLDAESGEASSAILSPCGRYRYRLGRRWSSGPLAVFCMANPSTADAVDDDPTIRRCVSFAKREGMGGLAVVNLYAFRATDPKKLSGVEDPIGPDNDRHIRAAIEDAALVIAAWGAVRVVSLRREVVTAARSEAVVQMLTVPRPRRQGGPGDWPIGTVYAFGTTADGSPRHPLYVANSTPLQAYRLPLRRST